MGFLRLILALSVVGAHCYAAQPLGFAGGEVAVQAFFIISGFYMAMVYKTYPTKAAFWKSRYLRLYPTYIVCALLALITIKSGQHGFFDLPFQAQAFLAFTNLTMLFQDLTLFLGVNDGQIAFTSEFYTSQPPLYQFLLVSPGWSLGLELTFYLIAPFILGKRTGVILMIALASVAVRLVVMKAGFSGDPWSYRFFPTELATFLAGSLAYRFHSQYPIRHNHWLGIIGLALMVALLGFFSYMPVSHEIKKLLVFFALLATIGPIFNAFKNSRMDRFVGNLSYPVYCSHLIIIGLLGAHNIAAQSNPIISTLLVYASVILFSTVLYFAIEKPTDIFRKRFKQPRKTQSSATQQAAPVL